MATAMAMGTTTTMARGTERRWRPPASRRRCVRSTTTTTTTTTGALPKRRLGHSGLEVTDVCLGTMTWGVQNTEQDAHAQLDYAVKERGVNFIDTAEMYPVPMSDPSWQPGTTEEYIGTWLRANPTIR